MARKCFMCGAETTGGAILCAKCDTPKKRRAETVVAAPPTPAVSAPDTGAAPQSIVSILAAAGIPSLLIGPDRSIKFVSDEAKKLLDLGSTILPPIAIIESKLGMRVTDLSVPTSAGTRIDGRNYIASLTPASGGAVMILRPADPMNESHASFMTYVRETVMEPLKSLCQSMKAASQQHPLFSDAASTLEQILSSLELAPAIQPSASGARPVPTVTEVVRKVAERFMPVAALKHVRLDIDAQTLEERFRDHEQLAAALSILLENALHYVPGGGQVIAGLRWMEHKGKPLLLFFVIDNGPLVPDHLRQVIFEPSFVFNPASSERTGRGLFKCREFAVNHGGSVWVEARTGKACTFFLRVRPDGAE